MSEVLGDGEGLVDGAVLGLEARVLSGEVDGLVLGGGACGLIDDDDLNGGVAVVGNGDGRLDVGVPGVVGVDSLKIMMMSDLACLFTYVHV